MPIVHGFDPPERFVAGTVGEPGSRTFFIQAREGARLVSVSLEKQQVAALAERIGELLDEVIAEGAAHTVVPAITPFDQTDEAPLEAPIAEDFRAGTMTLSWDPADERVVVEVFPVGEEPVELTDGEEPAEVLLVRLQPGQARSFVQRAEAVVGAGRATCPFCGQPIDPEGHLCVRANGFKRRDP